MSIRNRISNAIAALQGKTGDAYIIGQSLGESGRESRIEPLTRNFGQAIIRPKEVRQSATFSYKFADYLKMTVSELIQHLIFRSPEMKMIVSKAQSFLVQDYILDTDDPEAEMIIKRFIKEMGGKAKFLGVLKQIAYGIRVEGGSCMELSNGKDGMAKKIDWVSPWTLAAQKMEGDEGEYWVYGQQSLYGRLDPILYDESKPNPYFKYLPVGQEGNDPFGSSSLASITTSVVSLNNVITLLSQYIQGRVFPKKLFQVDVKTMSDLGYTKEQIEKAANKTEQLLKGKIDASDITQDLTLSVPIIATLVSGMERGGVDASDLMLDAFERQSQRGSGLPQPIYGSRRSGGLNDTEHRTQWGAFNIDIEGEQVLITEPISEFFEIILRQKGNMSDCMLKLLNNDVEINRINAEFFKMKAEAFTTVKGLGIYSQEELRKKFADSTKTSFDFSDLGPELPAELMNPMPADEPDDSDESDDPEGDDETDE